MARPFRFSFFAGGQRVVGPDATAGILIASEPASQARPADCAADTCSFALSTPGGRTARLDVSLSAHRANLRLTLPAVGAEVRFQTAGASPAFGLADQAALHPPYNTDVTGFHDDQFLSGQGLSRLVSNFLLYPRQGFAELLIDPETKIVHTSNDQIVEGVVHAGTTVTLDFFFGTTHDIYREYRQARIDAGYPWFHPKEEMFGVGWEAFGALGWNTNQKTVADSVDRYLSLGYRLRWIVIGSGFWPAEPRFNETTSFGMINQQKYPDMRALIAHFHQENLKVLFGIRITFITDGPFADEGVKNGYFLKQAGEARVFHGSWPKSPYYLLDAHNAPALNWYTALADRWNSFGVDGFKEDYYGFGGFGLRDDKVDPTNNRFMQQGKDIIERNGYLSVNGDLQRINDFNYDQNQDRGPVNALAFAYSGFPAVYPDIVGGTFGEQRFAITRSPRMETYMMRNAQWASLHSSMSMGEPPWSFQPQTARVMLQAAQLHDRLQPYLYAMAVRASQDGYPWPMTPLPVAFPRDPEVYGRENDHVRGYEWLIGDSLLATPLYGNDYDKAQTRDVYLPAGKWMDYDTGKTYSGGKLLQNFALPVGKTPLFVGGSGIIVERKGKEMVARLYPLGSLAVESYQLPGTEEQTIIDLSARHLHHARVIDETSHRTVTAQWERFAYQFVLEAGHRYSVRSQQ
ncbi:MAG TPA: TIM-barrel domain-containing protein [Terriglobia bacterium]|nr:TIM-barrel domain-containing protein [Terriglobia bacterium]